MTWIDYTSTPTALTPHVLELNGTPLHYWLGGPDDRPLVALMHGATMDHRLFNAQVPALLPDFRMLVWDARGHGRSRPAQQPLSLSTWASDLLAILDRHGVETAVVGGQSMGGMIAQQVYALAPERVRALILIDTVNIFPRYNPLEVWALRFSLDIFRFMPYDRMVEITARYNARRPDVRAYARDAVGQLSQAEFLAIWEGVTTAVSTQGNPRPDKEVRKLMVVGEHDQTGTIRRDAPGWADSDPNMTYAIIPNASHNANQDNPLLFNAILRRFLLSL